MNRCLFSVCLGLMAWSGSPTGHAAIRGGIEGEPARMPVLQSRGPLHAGMATGLVSATTPAAAIYNLFSDLASSLSEGNAKGFMKPFDPQMEGYAKLQDAISALMAQDLVSASIEVVRNEGDAEHRTVELDWFLRIISQQPTGPMARRRERVTCQVELRKKKWIIVSLKPLSFFAPPTSR